jgi:hypothetical protein
MYKTLQLLEAKLQYTQTYLQESKLLKIVIIILRCAKQNNSYKLNYNIHKHNYKNLSY